MVSSIACLFVIALSLPLHQGRLLPRLTFQHYHQLTDFHIFTSKYIWGDMDAFIIDGLGECFGERVKDGERG